MVRNCWTPATSDSTIGTIYPRTLVNSKIPLWNFASWKPDLVCVGIGTNDFISCNPNDPATRLADSVNFVKTYCDFLDTIRSKYSGVKIIINIPTARPWVINRVRQVVTMERAGGGTDVFYVPWQWDTTSNSMCWHPNVFQDSLTGKVMADSINSIMGWSTPVIANPAAFAHAISGMNSLVVRRVNGSSFSVETTDGAVLSGPVYIYRTNGERIEALLEKNMRGARQVFRSPVKGIVIVTALSNGRRLVSAPLAVY
jgi:hypothetical protein